ncbi:tetratricopeptide repeat protein [Dongia sedimenti]|uniref:Tetratricopeptide repeat protein n=1 Tax=Dongia sedimenti TaxID=3064282 RepID=A0ABU0YJU9_9PROT|nr:tetratricopeptide repeat protein [Rhodospirillaceae bacterium R-7]
MFRSLKLSASPRPGKPVLALAALLLGFNLAACSSDPPPDMNTVKKLVAEDRQFDALKILIPLAQDGDPQAQYELAGFYHYGYVGANDYAKALKWYRASARQGYADSMVGLSVMYLGGQGVAKDRREAFVWLNLAAQYMGDKQALAKVKAVRDEIGRTLTKDDIAFAKAESLLLQPETSSVQPNEAESIDHLPDMATTQEAPAAVATEPLQNVPPDTLPLTSAPVSSAPASSAPSLPQMELQPSLPAAPRPAAITTPPVTTKPASTTPASTLPVTTLPATTAPATPQPVPPPPLPPSSSNAAPATAVDPVPEF